MVSKGIKEIATPEAPGPSPSEHESDHAERLTPETFSDIFRSLGRLATSPQSRPAYDDDPLTGGKIEIGRRATFERPGSSFEVLAFNERAQFAHVGLISVQHGTELTAYVLYPQPHSRIDIRIDRDDTSEEIPTTTATEAQGRTLAEVLDRLVTGLDAGNVR